jgi:hypothetical protein
MEGIGVRSLACNTSRVEGRARISRLGLRRVTSESIIHTTYTNQTTSWLVCAWNLFGAPMSHGHTQIVATLTLGLQPRQGLTKFAGQEWSPWVTFHTPRTAGECEGMNPHTPKWAPTLRVRVPMDSWTFRGWLQRSKRIGLRSFFYHWNFFWNLDV